MAWRALDTGIPKVGGKTIKVPTISPRVKTPRLSRPGGLTGMANRQDPDNAMGPQKPLTLGGLMMITKPPKMPKIKI